MTTPPVLIVNAFVAASLLILDAVCVVITPVMVEAPLVLIILIAPPLLIPVPLIKIFSGNELIVPLISNDAPLDTVVLE